MTKILIIGFGSQAISWAKNLSESQIKVTVGLREHSTSFKKAQVNFETINLMKETSSLNQFKTIILLTPDNSHKIILQQIHSHLQPNSQIIYAHGYSLDKEKLNEKFPQFSHLLLAPKPVLPQKYALSTWQKNRFQLHLA